jgi:hypothetical protein
MTTTKELETLVARMIANGARATVHYNFTRNPVSIQIHDAKGIGPHPMAPIAAAETMRTWLAERS